MIITHLAQLSQCNTIHSLHLWWAQLHQPNESEKLYQSQEICQSAKSKKPTLSNKTCSLIYYQHILNIYITATDQWPKSQGFLRLVFTWNRVKVIIRKAEGYNEVKIKLTVLEEKRQCCSWLHCLQSSKNWIVIIVSGRLY